MPEAGETVEFVVTLHRGTAGTPSGTLRVVGDRHERSFDGWIGLIGALTEIRSEVGTSRGDGCPAGPGSTEQP